MTTTEAPWSPGSVTVTRAASRSAILRRVELEVTRRLDGLLTGEFLGHLPGPGTDPAQARLYGPGDDARRIDWNLSARALAPHVRTTEADHELETWMVADASASMDFGTALCEKRDLVLATVAAFGFMSLRGGNRFGLVTTGPEGCSRRPALSSRTALLAALRQLYDAPRRQSRPETDGDLATGLIHVAGIHRRRGRVVVVSDFLDEASWAKPLQRLTARHEVIAVQVVDPRELDLPDVGLLGVVDTETGRVLHVQTSSARLRARYRTAAQARQDHITSVLRSAGTQQLKLSTDRDWLLDIARFAARAHRGQRRSAAIPRSTFTSRSSS